MAYVSLEEGKMYLRVDSTFEDVLITGLLQSAEFKCRESARMSKEQWDAVETATGEITINDETYSVGEVQQMKEIIRVAILYCLGYLYEHRQEADHHDLDLTLRSLLCSIREGVF